MIRRYAEHRRAQAAETIERYDRPIRREIVRQAVDQVHLGADRPDGADRAAANRLDDVFGAAAVVRRLHDIPRHFRMHNDANTRVLQPDRGDLLRREASMNRAVAFPQNHLRASDLSGIETTEDLVRVPHHHLVEADAHLVGGVAAKMLVRQEQDLLAPREGPFQRGHRVGGRADGSAALADEGFDRRCGVDVGHRHDAAIRVPICVSSSQQFWSWSGATMSAIEQPAARSGRITC